MSRLNGIGDLIFLSLSCTVANARCNYSYTGDAMQVTIRPIEPVDPFHLTQAFAVWNKPLQQFEQYFLEHTTGFRTTFVAQIDTLLVGYTNILWFSDYIPFAEAGIPEIADLNVLPMYQRQGIATALIQACEQAIWTRGSTLVGIGVGLTEDYTGAQALYPRLGYRDDGRGIRTTPWGDERYLIKELALQIAVSDE